MTNRIRTLHSLLKRSKLLLQNVGGSSDRVSLWNIYFTLWWNNTLVTERVVIYYWWASSLLHWSLALKLVHQVALIIRILLLLKNFSDSLCSWDGSSGVKHLLTVKGLTSRIFVLALLPRTVVFVRIMNVSVSICMMLLQNWVHLVFIEMVISFLTPLVHALLTHYIVNAYTSLFCIHNLQIFSILFDNLVEITLSCRRSFPLACRR